MQESLDITLLRSVCLLLKCLSFAGEVLGHLCHHCGPEVYRELEPVLINGIGGNLERDQDLIIEHTQHIDQLSGRQSPETVEHRRVICGHIAHIHLGNLFWLFISISQGLPVLLRCSMTQLVGSLWKHTCCENFSVN